MYTSIASVENKNIFPYLNVFAYIFKDWFSGTSI